MYYMEMIPCRSQKVAKNRKIVVYSYRISLSRPQTDRDMGSAEKIRCPAGERLIVASCHRGRRDGSIPGSCLACILLKMI